MLCCAVCQKVQRNLHLMLCCAVLCAKRCSATCTSCCASAPWGRDSGLVRSSSRRSSTAPSSTGSTTGPRRPWCRLPPGQGRQTTGTNRCLFDNPISLRKRTLRLRWTDMPTGPCLLSWLTHAFAPFCQCFAIFSSLSFLLFVGPWPWTQRQNTL
jgi:hypothetical protein